MAKCYKIFLFTYAGSIIMNNLPIPDDREQLKRRQIADSLVIDLENFRTEATNAYSEYLPAERIVIDSLKADEVNVYNVLTSWEENLRPLLGVLRNKLSEVAFKENMMENLILEEDEVQNKIDEIIKARKMEVKNSFISKFYPIEKNIYDKQRKQIGTMLPRPELEIERIKNHYVNYLLHREAADQNNITVVDSHASLLKRIIAKKHIRRERKNALISENNRLLYINDRIKSLSAINGGLLVDIYNKKWDLIIVLDLRNNFEKKVSKLSKEDDKNAVKRLAIFDAITSDFKKLQTDKITVNSDQSSLETTRTITRDIDSLLLRIFDLSNIQKNQLLVYTKEYRELSQEKVSILSKQSSRHIS